MSKAMPPADVRAMMCRQATRRCLIARDDNKNNTKLNRSAVAQVVTYCALIATQNIFELDRDAMDRLTAEMIRRTEVYELEEKAFGTPKARRNLRDRTAPKMKEEFVLPVEKWPKKEWEKALLHERRDAGDLVVRFLVEALDDMGYTLNQIADVLKETRGNFRQFLDWSKDGEYVAYYKMAQCFEQSTGIEVTVDREPNEKPIFGDKFI